MKNLPPDWEWRDFLWPEIDGWHVVPLGVAIALAILVLSLAIGRLVSLILGHGP